MSPAAPSLIQGGSASTGLPQSRDLPFTAPTSTGGSHWDWKAVSETNTGTRSQENHLWLPCKPAYGIPVKSGVPPHSPQSSTMSEQPPPPPADTPSDSFSFARATIHSHPKVIKLCCSHQPRDSSDPSGCSLRQLLALPQPCLASFAHFP